MSSSYVKNSRPRGKSPGWASFDLKQRQLQGPNQYPLESNDPFPPLPANALHPNEKFPVKNGFSSRPFSSLCRPENVNVHKLKADSVSLVEVNNDIHKATALLNDISTGSSRQNGYESCQPEKGEDKCVFLDSAADITDLSSSLEDAFKDSNGKTQTYSGKRLSEDKVANLQLIMEQLRSLPVQPEWEEHEHDVYMSHRRNALRKIRLASKHSRAATRAFMRGDYFSAHQFSLKATDERLDAERLNAKAAREILSIRNNENDPWTLDLHGLHAAEAVRALQGHLEKIETQLPKNRLVYPSSTEIETVQSSLKSFSGMNAQNADKNQTEFRPKSSSLHVITGVGNHSKGEAALPGAVRSFLNENRYHFDEATPGVIVVRPKFRIS